MNPALQISTELEIVVLKALAKQADDRWATMKEFGEALLGTPEGLRLGRSISSVIGLGEVAAAPTRPKGRATEVHGSPSTAPGPTPAPAAHTLTEVELPRSSLLPLWVGLGTVLVLGGVGALFWQRSQSEPAAPAPVTAAPAPVAPTPAPSAAPVDSAPVPEPQVTPPPADSALAAAPAQVTIHVSTVPSGALVTKDGFQVCDASPCEVSLDVGSTAVLSARLGSKTGSAKVLAQREQSVTISLGAAAKPAPKPAEGPALCEVEVEGLKILRPCK